MQWYRLDLIPQLLNCFSPVTSWLSNCPVTDPCQSLWWYWVQFHRFLPPYPLQADCPVPAHLERVIINHWGSALLDFIVNIHYCRDKCIYSINSDIKLPLTVSHAAAWSTQKLDVCLIANICCPFAYELQPQSNFFYINILLILLQYTDFQACS